MSITPPKLGDDAVSIADSWVEVNGQILTPPRRSTPLPLTSDEYLRLLREAQRDSAQISSRASLASSRFASPKDVSPSPKSPPNSPNPELETYLDSDCLRFYVNKGDDAMLMSKNSDWVWDWTSRPDLTPPKGWVRRRQLSSEKPQQCDGTASISCNPEKASHVINGSVTRGALYTFIVTNIVSLLLGAGIGYWLTKRAVTVHLVPLD